MRGKYLENKECIMNWRNENKGEYKEYLRKYHENNKEKLNKQRTHNKKIQMAEETGKWTYVSYMYRCILVD